MDQLKNILKPLAKHHFWILCVVAITAAIVGWFMASKALTAVYNQQKSAIEGKFKSLVGIKGEENPPNETWKDGVATLTTKQKQSVSTAWTKVYDEQKDVLKWPAEILGKDFVSSIDSHPSDWDIDMVNKNVYHRKIHEAFPRLLKIVDAAPAADPKADPKNPGATPGSDAGAKNATPAVVDAAANDYTLFWAPTSQALVKETLEWDKTPSSLEIRRAQEDLWVYEALLKIIAAANSGGGLSSPVKELADIRIGREAAKSFEEGMRSGHIFVPMATGLPAGGAVPGAVPQAPPPTPPPDPGAQGGAPGAASKDEGRYVDADGKPQTFADAAQKPFKRMPVLLHVVMDQRALPKLLAECANSPLPVEVKQLRITAPKSSGGSSSGSGGDHGGARHGGGGNRGAKFEGPGLSFEVPVEILGIIYIYNKPPSEQAPGGAPPPVPAG